MHFKIIFSFICLIVCLNKISAESRKLTVSLNPNCNEKCNKPDANGSYVNLVWAKLVGEKDEIHFLYSTIDSFSIMAFRTNLSANLTINWDNLLTKNSSLMNNSIIITPAPIESAGYSLPVFYEYDDEDGVANITKIPNNESYWVTYQTKNFVWKPANLTNNNVITFESKISNETNGTIKFVIEVYGEDEKRDSDLPHLLLNSGSSSVDFIIDSVDPTFKFSKFAASLVLMNKFQNSTQSSVKTLDDEYTPGTFNLWNIETLNTNTNEVNSYLQWKPIFYFYNPRTLENSTITYQYDLNRNQSIPSGIGAVFFDSKSFVYGINISFGIEGDQKNGFFYPQTNYSAWSFSVGIGAAPVEKMSVVVSIVIAAGFGLPALVIVVGLLTLMIKKCRKSKDYANL